MNRCVGASFCALWGVGRKAGAGGYGSRSDPEHTRIAHVVMAPGVMLRMLWMQAIVSVWG